MAEVQQAVPPDTGRLLFEIKKVIVGQDHLIERLMVGLLARGHLLVEGVPGLAKTLSVKTVAQAITGDFKRIQFTPDLVPADLVGTRIYNQRAGDFQTSLGPVFTNPLLADEINRAPAKVQSALLEVMQERQVTIGRETHKVPDPFLVMATQNPIETEGTYALPEAQVDRFMLKVLVGYPSEMDEFVVVERVTGHMSPVVPVMTTERRLQRLEWTVIRRLDGLLQGNYRTIFKGQGLDLADIREYVFGDDVRHIDWNVTARLDAPYVREYLEDREINAHFLLDLSPSVDFGTVDRRKRDLLVDFTAVLARLLTRHGNRVGATLYASRVERSIPARGGRVQVLRILNELEKRPRLQSAPLTSLSDLLDSGMRGLKRRSLVFVISDFFSAAGWEDRLERVARRHETLAVRLADPREDEMPDIGTVILTDSETGEQVRVNTGDPRFRQRFAAAAQRREQMLNATFARAGVDVLVLRTDEDLVRAIVKFAYARKRRAGRRAAMGASA